MKSQEKFIACVTLGGLIGLGFAGIYLFISASPLRAQEMPYHHVLRSEIRHIGSAEVRAISKDHEFYPKLQPPVYWHDEDWKIDLTPTSSPNAFSLTITSEDGREKTVKLPWAYSQIDGIYRAPNDKAIVLAEINGKIEDLGIVDLRLAKVIDDIAMVAPSISPDRRFIMYVNTDYYDYYNYRLYDVSKTPLENTCGYRENDPQHKDLDEAYRGFPIYPRWANQFLCYDKDMEAFNNENHARASDFVWAADSSKVVFADASDDALSLILVTTPNDKGDHNGMDQDRGAPDRQNSDRDDLPRTSVYKFVGLQDVCAGAANCDYNNVKSVAWDGDAVAVALIQANPGGAAIEKDLAIPISKFVPIEPKPAPKGR